MQYHLFRTIQRVGTFLPRGCTFILIIRIGFIRKDLGKQMNYRVVGANYNTVFFILQTRVYFSLISNDNNERNILPKSPNECIRRVFKLSMDPFERTCQRPSLYSLKTMGKQANF